MLCRCAPLAYVVVFAFVPAIHGLGILLCVCLRPWYCRVGALGAPLHPTCPTYGWVDSCMVGVRRGVATSTHIWPPIPGLPGGPLRGLSGTAPAPTGDQSRMIQSGAPGRYLSGRGMIQPGRGDEYVVSDTVPPTPPACTYS